MYVHPAFKVHPATALAFAAARGFGIVMACDGGRPVAAHLPFRLIEADGKVPKLEFHVARNNALGAIAEKGGTWMVAVAGHDTYVSPDWYASKEQVPTWLYEAVHLSGPVRLIGGDHMRGHTERLSSTFETWLTPKPAWTLDKVAEQRRDMLLKGIVGIEMTIESIEGNFKLNQHKCDEDQVAVVNALSRQNDAAAREIAKRMQALRPHLGYARSHANAPIEAPALAGK
ncbi:MAG: transcriptional regulator [Hyphomicrobiales bacterium]|nr:transcriptional regulator [Hyphomicrobiales bacterium]